MKRFWSQLLSGLCLLFLVSSALAVMTGDEEPPPRVGDADYAAGVLAWKAEDWQGVIEHMTKVLERRPWHDNAHNLMGFAFRKLGDYERALAHYHKALELNPYHRGVLEYLGEAYLEMGCPSEARAMLEKLAALCGRSDAGKPPDCEEWQTLKAAIENHDSTSGDNL